MTEIAIAFKFRIILGNGICFIADEVELKRASDAFMSTTAFCNLKIKRSSILCLTSIICYIYKRNIHYAKYNWLKQLNIMCGNR